MRVNNVSICKVIFGLVLTLAVLQLFYISILSQYNLQKENSERERKASYIQKLFDDMRDIYNERHIMDSSGKYSIVTNVWQGSTIQDGKRSRDVSLIIHCSIDRMFNIFEISKLWDGPMSVTVFTPGQDAIVAMEHIIRLHYCHGQFIQNAVFHFVFPITLPAQDIKMYTHFEHYSICGQAFRAMKSTRKIEYYGVHGLKYPNNLLRNVGIRHSHTEYVLVADVDIVPKRSLRRDFMDFALRKDLFSSNKTKEPVIYAVPAFEIKNAGIPYNKQELFQGLSDGFIRQFYIEPCQNCQGILDYDRWLSHYKLIKDSDPLDIANIQEWSHPWEPIYFVHHSVPLYDERFLQYGYNRISQMCELYMANYQIAVLNHGFVVHLGFKFSTGFHETKDDEMKTNLLLFNQFKEELKTKYGSRKKC